MSEIYIFVSKRREGYYLEEICHIFLSFDSFDYGHSITEVLHIGFIQFQIVHLVVDDVRANTQGRG